MTDWPRLERLALIATARFRRSEYYDDLYQTALIDAWGNQHLPDPHIVRRAQFAAIDEHRRLTGSRSRLPHLPLIDAHTVTDPELRPSLALNLAGRAGWIADRIAEGWHNRDIAARLGVTESRVSQLARRIGKKVGR